METEEERERREHEELAMLMQLAGTGSPLPGEAPPAQAPEPDPVAALAASDHVPWGKPSEGVSGSAPMPSQLASYRDAFGAPQAAGPEHMEGSHQRPVAPDYDKHMGGSRGGRIAHRIANALTFGLAGWEGRVDQATRDAEAEADYLTKLAKWEDSQRQIGQQLGSQLGLSGDTTVEEAQFGTQMGRSGLLRDMSTSSRQAQRLGARHQLQHESQDWRSEENALDRESREQMNQARLAGRRRAAAGGASNRPLKAVLDHPDFARAWADIRSGHAGTPAVRALTEAYIQAGGKKPHEVTQILHGAYDRGQISGAEEKTTVSNVRSHEEQTAGARTALGSLDSDLEALGPSGVDLALEELGTAQGVAGQGVSREAKHFWNALRGAVARYAFALGGKALTNVEKTMTLGQLGSLIATSSAAAAGERRGLMDMAFAGFVDSVNRGSVTYEDILQFRQDADAALAAARESTFAGAQLGAAAGGGVPGEVLHQRAEEAMREAARNGSLPFAPSQVIGSSIELDPQNRNFVRFRTRDGGTHVLDPATGEVFDG